MGMDVQAQLLALGPLTEMQMVGPTRYVLHAEVDNDVTEQQRVEHHILMGGVAPTRGSGLAQLIADRLGLHCGTRKKREGEEKGRPFAFDQAIDRRAHLTAATP